MSRMDGKKTHTHTQSEGNKKEGFSLSAISGGLSSLFFSQKFSLQMPSQLSVLTDFFLDPLFFENGALQTAVVKKVLSFQFIRCYEAAQMISHFSA